MSTVGGFFCGKPLPPRAGEDPNIVHQYAFVWGRVLYDAQDTTRKKRTVRFLVKYDEEPNPRYGKLDAHGKPEKMKRGKFMRCNVWGKENIANVMASVEREDIVICFGRLRSKDYRRKDHTLGKDFQIDVDVVIPMAAIGFVLELYGSQGIQKILNGERNAAPDVWESD